MEGHRFALSAFIASSVLIFGEQVRIVLWSPSYFSNIGEFIWNLFVCTSFLSVFVTLYGFAGGVCWQSMVDHVDPVGRIMSLFRESRREKMADQILAASLFGAVVALGVYILLVFTAQLHVSTTYSNRSLSGLLLLAILVLLIPPVVGIYGLVRRMVVPIAGLLERLFPRHLFTIEAIMLILAAVGLVSASLWFNNYLLEAIDFRPFIVLHFFFMMQIGVYYLLGHPFGQSMANSASHFISLTGWLIILGAMLTVTVLAYPSQASVASIMHNETLFTKHIIYTCQYIWDFDDDGFSPILNGGDCNDSNHRVFPVAQEIPGNGLDDDCMGGDASEVVRKKRKIDDIMKLRIASLQKKYNIILISIDAARADHYGYMGYQRDTSPEIDALASESMVFSRAYTTAPNTPQSIPSFITGMFPSQIHWSHYHNFPKILSQTETVMDVAKREGYQVSGVFSHWYFDKRNLQRDADSWDIRAFRSRDHSERAMTDDLVTNYAIEGLKKLEERDQPAFMWLHYFDPHFLYVRHDGDDFGTKQIDLYDGELRSNSREVGRFLDTFKKSPLYKNSVIILFADHGEEFLEHGRKWHGSQLYEESVHVPLIIHSPLLPKGYFDQPVSLVDVAPTLLDLIGAEKAKEKMQGHSLLPHVLSKGRHPLPPVYIEKLKAPSFPWSIQALIDGRWKLIHKANEQLFELYDLQTDPGEKRNVYRLLPEKAAQMRMRLGEYKLMNLTNDTGWYSMASNLSQ